MGVRKMLQTCLEGSQRNNTIIWRYMSTKRLRAPGIVEYRDFLDWLKACWDQDFLYKIILVSTESWSRVFLTVKKLGLSRVSISSSTLFIFICRDLQAYAKGILFNLNETSNSVKMHGYIDCFIEGTVNFVCIAAFRKI